MVQLPTSEKIEFDVSLTDIVKSAQKNMNISVRSFLETLVAQRMQGRISIIWNSAKESKIVKSRAPMETKRRKLQPQQKEIVSRKDTLVLL